MAATASRVFRPFKILPGNMAGAAVAVSCGHQGGSRDTRMPPTGAGEAQPAHRRAGPARWAPSHTHPSSPAPRCPPLGAPGPGRIPACACPRAGYSPVASSAQCATNYSMRHSVDPARQSMQEAQVATLFVQTTTLVLVPARTTSGRRGRADLCPTTVATPRVNVMLDSQPRQAIWPLRDWTAPALTIRPVGVPPPTVDVCRCVWNVLATTNYGKNWNTRRCCCLCSTITIARRRPGITAASIYICCSVAAI